MIKTSESTTDSTKKQIITKYATDYLTEDLTPFYKTKAFKNSLTSKITRDSTKTQILTKSSKDSSSTVNTTNSSIDYKANFANNCKLIKKITFTKSLSVRLSV